MADTPATVVLCGRFSPRTRAAGSASGTIQGRPPVTWLASLDDLKQAAGDPAGGVHPDTALVLEPSWLESRRRLRDAIHHARTVAGNLDAAVLTGAPLREHGLLAELGIRIVVVDRLGPCNRGARRPTPSGWPCRNVTWGLWEVEKVDLARRPGFWHLLTHGRGLPTTRAGTLQLLCDEGSGTAGHPRLGRWIDATARRQARGAVVAVRLGDLPALLETGSSTTVCPPGPGSLLKAA